eukprot:Pgem_evm1s5479
MSQKPILADKGNSTIVRKTTKFIMQQCNVPSFVEELQKILPISPFRTGQGQFVDGVDTVKNSSVYFDTDGLTMYEQRVYKADKADLYRTRVYGDYNDKTGNPCFLERKRHRDTDITGKESTKKRALYGSQPDDKQYKNLIKFQSKIDELNLKPKVQTDYFRTSFLNAEDVQFDGLRVTLDEHISVSNPNIPETAKEYHVFPYAVIEIKVLVKEGEEKKNPEWLVELIEQHQGTKLKVSKYNTGCMLLYPEVKKPEPNYYEALEEWLKENINKDVDEQRHAGNTDFSNTVVVMDNNIGDVNNPNKKQIQDQFNTALTIDNNNNGLAPLIRTSPESSSDSLRERKIGRGLGCYAFSNRSNSRTATQKHGYNIFTNAREECFKFDMKVMMAAERTYMRYVQFGITLAFFALAFLHIKDTEQLRSEVKPLVTAVVVCSDVIVMYASIIYHLRRNFIVGVIEKRNLSVPPFFNDWI